MYVIILIYKAENVRHYVSLTIFHSLNFEQHKPAGNCAPRDKNTPLKLNQLLSYLPSFLTRCCTYRSCLSGRADLPLTTEEMISHAGHYTGLDHSGSCSHSFWGWKSWMCSIRKARARFSLQPECCCSSASCQYLTSLSSWIISPVLNPTPLIPTKWVCFQRSLLVKYW